MIILCRSSVVSTVWLDVSVTAMSNQRYLSVLVMVDQTVCLGVRHTF